MSATLRKMSLLAVIGTLLLTLGADLKRPGGLQVQGFTVQGMAVNVVVANTSGSNLSGTVTVRPLLILPPVSVHVAVPARQNLTVRVTFAAAITGGVTCGVVLDDGAPF